jgi:hypothetical protein
VVQWVVQQGASFRRSLFWESAPGVPVNLTGYTGAMQFRRHLGGEVEFSATLEFASEAYDFDRTDGRIDVVIPYATTEGLSGIYIGQLEVTSGGDERTRLVKVELAVDGESTR